MLNFLTKLNVFQRIYRELRQLDDSSTPAEVSRNNDNSRHFSPERPPFDAQAKIEALETEVKVLKKKVRVQHLLLNDVMRQLDPFIQGKRNQVRRNGIKKKYLNLSSLYPKPKMKPKRAEPTGDTNANPPQKGQSEKSASAQANAEALERLKAYLSDGKRCTEDEIREALDLSKGMFRRIRKKVKNNGNTDPDERLYFVE